MKKIILSFMFFISAFAADLMINTSSGEDYFLAVSPEDSFHEVINTLQHLENSSAGVHITLNVQKNLIQAKTKGKTTTPPTRNYYIPLSTKDKESITYLLTTLANQNAIKVLFKRSSLEEAGDKIRHVHPMAFLRFVFTNDELIVAMRLIREKSLIWGDFVDPIVESLMDEIQRGNLTEDQMDDLTAATKIDPSLTKEPIKKRNPKLLIENLLKKVKRNDSAKGLDI